MPGQLFVGKKMNTDQLLRCVVSPIYYIQIIAIASSLPNKKCGAGFETDFPSLIKSLPASWANSDRPS